MPPTKSDRLISRITALHHSLELDKDETGPSPLERDLMLGYLRELYDIYLNAGSTSIENRTTADRQQAPSTPTPTAAPLIAPAPPPPPSPPPVPEVPPPPPPPPAPSYTEHTAIVVPEPSRPAPAPPQPAPEPAGSPEIEALFNDVKGFGNSAMRQRVPDLTRALSINNRVLFQKKLFGNDGEALNLALRDLNLKGSMEYAKPTLVKLADRHRWADDDQRETAREFIDLVSRRYA